MMGPLSRRRRVEFLEVREADPAQQVLKLWIVMQELVKPFAEAAHFEGALFVRLLEQPEHFIALAKTQVNRCKGLRRDVFRPGTFVKEIQIACASAVRPPTP
jgi:hypothetical protein